VGVLKKLLGGRDEPGAAPRAAVPAQPPAYDRTAGAAAYERLAAAALLLRSLDAELARAAGDVAAREEKMRASMEEYDRIARAAIAGGRTIQAESAIASSEAAEAALHALAPRAGELAALRHEVAATATRIEGEAQALRDRLDSRAPYADPAAAVARAEDDAVRLASLARSLSA
jgi:hypothetical protein